MDVDRAISRCPFLHNLSQTEGKAFASSIAINPLLPASSARRPVLEEQQDFAATFRLFHGQHGVVPLARSAAFEATPPARCPMSAPSQLPAKAFQATGSETERAIINSSKAKNPFAGAPMATMSLGMPDFGDFFHHFHRRHPPQPKPNPRKPLNNSNRGDIGKPASASGNASSSKTVRPSNFSSGPTPSGSAASGAPAAGGCPLRKLLGPMAGLVFNKAGHVQCPQVIIQARAALAATAPVKSLRPQALPVKLIAVGAVAAAANVPCGMWREHTKKFSLQWFMAVHASIPFIAMLRKAVIMPKLAIVLTIAAAVAGQALGARLERERLKLELQEQGPNMAMLRAPLSSAVLGLEGEDSKVEAHVVRGAKLKGKSIRAMAQPMHSDQFLEACNADWRMDPPGVGSFMPLRLDLPAMVAAH